MTKVDPYKYRSGYDSLMSELHGFDDIMGKVSL